MEVKVLSPDGDTDFFDIADGVLQGDTLASYLFIIYLNYVPQTLIDLLKENGFTLKKQETETITDTDYVDVIALLVNTPTQGKSQLHNLEQSAGGIGLHVNADKTEYMCFNQKGDISTLHGSSLKLVDKFMYLSSCI